MSLDSKARFSTRVENYVRYRPGYPDGVRETLQKSYALGPGKVVVDVGSGTGISARLLLQTGVKVLGIEPNAEMRRAAEAALGHELHFRSVAASAEETGLEPESVDLVVAGQAFHWFNPPQARAEFARVLRPPRPVALLWNERVPSGSAFLEGYESLLREFSPDYLNVRHDDWDEAAVAAWFGNGTLRIESFANEQSFDYAGLEGRLLSSSYTPEAGQAAHAPMIAELRRLFDATQEHGRVVFQYRTRLYRGDL